MFLRTQRKLCLLFIFAVNLTLFRRMSPGVNYGRKEEIPCSEPLMEDATGRELWKERENSMSRATI